MPTTNSIHTTEDKTPENSPPRCNRRTSPSLSVKKGSTQTGKSDSHSESPNGSPRSIIPSPVHTTVPSDSDKFQSAPLALEYVATIPYYLPPFLMTMFHWSPVARLRDSVQPSLPEISLNFGVTISLLTYHHNVAGFAAMQITGPAHQLFYACSALLALPDARLRYISGPKLENGKCEAVCMAPRAHAALLIGRGGATRRAIERATGAKLALRSPRDFATPQCEMRIFGRIGQIRTAAIEVAKIVSSTRIRELKLALPCSTFVDERLETRSFTVRRHEAAKLVGRLGANAQYIRKACKVEIWVEGCGKRTSNKTVFVRGGEYSVERAFSLMHHLAGVGRYKFQTSLN